MPSEDLVQNQLLLLTVSTLSPLLPKQSTYKNLPDLSSVGVDRTSLDSFSCLGIIPLKKGYGSSQGMAECSTPSLSRVMINPLGSVLAKSMHSNTNCLNALSISGKWKTSIDENEDKFIIYKWDKSFDIDVGEIWNYIRHGLNHSHLN